MNSKVDIYQTCAKRIVDLYKIIQQKKDESWSEYFDQIIMEIGEIINYYCNSNEYIDSLSKILILVERAMINKDYFLMSDYLYYGVKPLIENSNVYVEN